jgi:hypothetical protein
LLLEQVRTETHENSRQKMATTKQPASLSHTTTAVLASNACLPIEKRFTPKCLPLQANLTKEQHKYGVF